MHWRCFLRSPHSFFLSPPLTIILLLSLSFQFRTFLFFIDLTSRKCLLLHLATPYYPSPRRKFHTVTCEVSLWADMNAAIPPGSRGRSALCAVFFSSPPPFLPPATPYHHLSRGHRPRTNINFILFEEQRSIKSSQVKDWRCSLRLNLRTTGGPGSAPAPKQARAVQIMLSPWCASDASPGRARTRVTQ